MEQTPYAPPESEAQAAGTVPVFSFTDRLGRVRYIGYSMALGIVTFVALMLSLVVIAAIAGEQSVLVALLATVMGVAATVVSVMFAIRRLHDMNLTGWIALVSLVPLLNLLFTVALMLVPGTKGENRFGPQTPPNGTGAILLACLAPLPVFVFGIVASIGVPAFEDYTARAQVGEAFTLASTPKAVIANFAQETGRLPVSEEIDQVRAWAELPVEGAYAYLDLDSDTAAIVAVMKPEATSELVGGARILFEPQLSADGGVSFVCRSTDLDSRLLPSACIGASGRSD